MHALEAKVAAIASATSSSAGVGQQVVAGQGFAADRARHQALVADHFKEVIDPKWAPMATKALSASLEDAAKSGGFKLQEMACRDTTCRAVAEWPTFAEAAQHYRSIMDAELSLNCGRTVALVDDAVPGKPYRTTVILDCSGTKYGS